MESSFRVKQSKKCVRELFTSRQRRNISEEFGIFLHTLIELFIKKKTCPGQKFANPARSVWEMQFLFINDMRARSPGVASALLNHTPLTVRSRVKKTPPCHKSDNVMPIYIRFTSARKLSTASNSDIINYNECKTVYRNCERGLQCEES
jgi:hypothetical protein